MHIAAVKALASETAKASEAVEASELLALLPVGAKLIVELALFRILQNLVGFVDFLELLLGALVAGIEVRMVFFCKLLVSSGYRVLVCGTIHAQELVVILIGNCHGSST